MAIVMLGTIALLGALGFSASNIRSSEPKLKARGDLANLSTDLNAVTMYDANALALIKQKQSFTMPVPPTPAPSGSPAHYIPSDLAPTVITVTSVTQPGTSSSRDIGVTYSLATGSSQVGGTAIIGVLQRAPKFNCSQATGTC